MSEWKYNFWLKTRKKSTYPKSLHSSCHINKAGNMLLLHCSGPQKLVQIVINSQTYQIESKITLITEDCTNLDTTFFHRQSFLVNSRVYFLQNSIPKELHHVYCADFDLKKLFPIKNVDTKPSGFRTNYSATLYHFRILIFGGMNENNQPTSAFDSFDISTYKWEKIITQGKLPAARHSHCAEIVKDQLVVIGGTKACDIFDREGYLSEIHILDLNTLTWTQIAHDGNVPLYMSYAYSFKLEEDKILFLWNDRANHSHTTESSVFQVSTKKWQALPIMSQKPEHRYSAGACFNEQTKQVIIFGGFSFTENEMNCISNDLDQLCLYKEEDPQAFSNLELYGGIKYSTTETSAPVLIPEKAKDKYFEADIEDISFEKLLEIEKRAEEEEKMRLNSSSSNTIESDSGRDNSKAVKGNKANNNKPSNQVGASNSGGNSSSIAKKKKKLKK